MRQRLTNRNYLAGDSNPQQALATVETFDSYAFNSAGSGPVIASTKLPVVHQWGLPPQCRAHYVYIAAGAHYQKEADDLWMLQGRVAFYRGGREVGSMNFSDASAQTSDTGIDLMTIAKRPLIRMHPGGDGSTQPVIRYQAFDGSDDDPMPKRDNLDMAAFYFPVEADRMTYEIDVSRYRVATGPLHILTGARIISVI